MPVIYTIHPNKDERSKIRHILTGRDFLIFEYETSREAEINLNKKRADICLMPPDIHSTENQAFLRTLNEIAADCPIILLTDKDQINEAVQMVGENGIFDYFLMHPIVDPIRLHIMIDKALTQCGIQLNLEDLKRRLADLPGNFPKLFDEQAEKLKRDISYRVSEFKNRMKGEEFQNIVHLHFLDEDAFDNKFDEFQNDEIGGAIDQNRNTMSEMVARRLTDFTLHLQEQIDDPIRYEDLSALREKLAVSSETPDDAALSDKTSDHIADGVNYAAESTILFIDDEKNPSNHIPEIIEKFGYRVLIAQSPLKLLELAKSDHVDLVLCGYDLGKIDGIELSRRIKEGLGKASLPIILLTSHPTDEILELCKNVGISDVITLPLLPNSLKEKIAVHLNKD